MSISKTLKSKVFTTGKGRTVPIKYSFKVHKASAYMIFIITNKCKNLKPLRFSKYVMCFGFKR